MRLSDLTDKLILDELLRLGKLDRDWVRIEFDGEHYRCWFTQKTFIRKAISCGADSLGMKAMSRWLLDGPKVFRPTVDQMRALEQVEVKLPLADYEQPFESLLVEVDVLPFKACLCYFDKTPGPHLILHLFSDRNKDDIVTPITTMPSIELAINRFYDDTQHLREEAVRAYRIAVNSCLALCHYGHHTDYLFPKEVENDRRLAREDSERGERARKRLPLAVQRVSFSQEVKLNRADDTVRERSDGDPLYSVSCHWRRGHWARQPFGEGRQQRKLVFRKPVLVRADIFTGDRADTSVTYKG